MLEITYIGLNWKRTLSRIMINEQHIEICVVFVRINRKGEMYVCHRQNFKISFIQ